MLPKIFVLNVLLNYNIQIFLLNYLFKTFFVTSTFLHYMTDLYII